MKKTLIICVLLPLIAGSVGLWLGGGALKELLEEPEKSTAKAENPHLIENRELRQSIRDAQRTLSVLDGQRQEAAQVAKKTLELNATKLISKPGESAEMTSLRGQIAALKSDIQRAQNGEIVLDQVEIAQRIAEIKAAFEKAKAEGDGDGMVSALGELAKLGESAYPDVLKLWKQLNDSNWSGLGFRARFGMGWADKELFAWSLTAGGLGVDAETARKFQGTAVMAYRRMEPDAAKRAQTYSTFLTNSPAPAPLTDAQKNATGFQRMMTMMEDPYRGAVMQVSRTNDPSSVSTLNKVISDQEVPSDVKKVALTGLAKNDSPEAAQAIDDALNDPDPEIQEAADLAKKLSEPTIAGFFILTVTDGPLKTAGVVPGDYLITYNGVVVRGMRDLFRLPQDAETETVEVVINSGGVIKKVEVPTDTQLGISGDYVQPEAPESDSNSGNGSSD
ncbi:MAG: hypothetical protein P1V97_36585 [Planctomycetota bacterium]|nr:hypothetical protein [Planctomycetota bacterium]